MRNLFNITQFVIIITYVICEIYK